MPSRFRSVNMGVTLVARRAGTKQARTAIADISSATCRKREGIRGLLLGTSRSISNLSAYISRRGEVVRALAGSEGAEESADFFP